jgi:hypothetical protein
MQPNECKEDAVMYDWQKQKYILALALVVLMVGAFSSPVNAQTKVVSMEYYIDSDPGQGMGIPIPAADGSYDSSEETGEIGVNTTGWLPGAHMVYVRALSSTGVWGTFPMKLLYINDPQTQSIDRVEYFFDVDPGLGNGIPMTAVDGNIDGNSERMIARDVDISGLVQGDHILYVRAKDKAGIWGPERSIPFEVLPPITVKSVEIGLGKNDDTEPSDQKSFMQPIDGKNDSPVEELIVTLNAPMQAGTHSIFIRAMNNELTWSEWQSFVLNVTDNPMPTPTPTVTPPPGEPTPLPTPTPTIMPVDPNRIEMFATLLKTLDCGETTLAECGWMEVPGGFENNKPGTVSTQTLDTSLIPTSKDGKGLLFELTPSTVTMLMGLESVPVNSNQLVLIKAFVRSQGSNAQLVLGGLKGKFVTSENVDGSLVMNLISNSATYSANEGEIAILYKPDAGDQITPFFQASWSGLGFSTEKVWLDRIEIYQVSQK